MIRKVVSAYGEARPNLLKHSAGAGRKRSTSSRSSHPANRLSAWRRSAGQTFPPAAKAILVAADRNDPRPLWITVWGRREYAGAGRCCRRRAARTPQALSALLTRLRVYSISDQDDAGPWIRGEFPALQYIVRPSQPNSVEYPYATWTGISGDVFYATARARIRRW